MLLLLRALALLTSSNAPALLSRVYVEGVAGVPQEANPLLQKPYGVGSEADLSALLFEGLTRLGADGQPVPALAEYWEIGSAGTVYTFTLRSGLRWHDGVELTADDVAFSVQSVQSPDFAGDDRVAEPWRAVRAEALDDLRVRFELSAPFAPFLASTTLPIVPHHLLGDVAPADWASAPFSRRPIGAGPFRLHTLDAREAMLVPFEGSVRGRPKLDLLVLRFYPSVAIARAALQRNEVQGVAWETGQHPGDETSTDMFQRLRLPLAGYTMLAMNLRVAPLDNQELRVALAQALDREELLRRAVGDGVQLLASPILPQTPFHGAATLPIHAPIGAEQTLERLGWRPNAVGLRERNGTTFSLRLMCADSVGQPELAREIARQWRTVGIEVAIDIVPREVLQTRLQGRDFVLALQNWAVPTADPDIFALWHSSQAPAGANYAGLVDTRIDTLLANGRSAVDQTRREELYQEFEERWIALAPSVPLYQSSLTYELAPGVSPAGLDSSRLLPTASSRFDAISEWAVESP